MIRSFCRIFTAAQNVAPLRSGNGISILTSAKDLKSGGKLKNRDSTTFTIAYDTSLMLNLHTSCTVVTSELFL